MRRRSTLLVFAASALALVLGAPPIASVQAASNPIDHVVVLMQENRSFDTYFGQLHFEGQNQAMPEPPGASNPNPLDPTDANKDFDGDGMTMNEEFAAWIAFGNHSLPLNYSDGKQYSPAPDGPGRMDLDNNGRISDDEKDADNDGLPNWAELAKGENAPPSNGQGTCAFRASTGPNAQWDHPDIFTDCGAGLVARPRSIAHEKSLLRRFRRWRLVWPESSVLRSSSSQRMTTAPKTVPPTRS